MTDAEEVRALVHAVFEAGAARDFERLRLFHARGV
jgi:hypothetical protein